MTKKKSLNSVEKAIKIVEYLASTTTQGASLTEITESVGLNKATAHHTLSTLKTNNWVLQDPDTTKYRLGYGLIPVTRYFTKTDRVVAELHGSLVNIGKEINELVHLGTLSGNSITYLDKVEPERTIRVVSEIGRHARISTTALGRALIGAKRLSKNETRDLWEAEITDTSDQSSTVARKELWNNFYRAVTHQHKFGWTYEDEENEDGIACVAVPLFVHGSPLVAISVTAPVDRFGNEERIGALRAVATELSTIPAELGISLPDPLEVPAS